MSATVTVKKEIDNDKNWGGIPPSVLREERSAPESIPSAIQCNKLSDGDIQHIPHRDDCAKTEESTDPPIDTNSKDGKFGWTKVNNVDLPFILRGDEHYVSVRMIELKLLKLYFQTLPMQLFAIVRVNSEYVTTNEAALLNEINMKHCGCNFGKNSFTRYDLIVQEDAVKEMCEFLRDCHHVVIGSNDKVKTNCGILSFCSIKVPYVVVDNSKWVPKGMASCFGGITCGETRIVDKWQMGYLKLCCYIGKLEETSIKEDTEIVRVQDVLPENEKYVVKEIKLSSLANACQSTGSSSGKDYQNGGDANGQLYARQQKDWIADRNSSSTHLSSSSSQRLSSSQHMNLPPYSPTSSNLVPNRQQLSPCVEPTRTASYGNQSSQFNSPHINHVNLMNHHVPFVSTSLSQTSSNTYPTSRHQVPHPNILYKSLNNQVQTNEHNNLYQQQLQKIAQESQRNFSSHISSLQNGGSRKRPHTLSTNYQEQMDPRFSNDANSEFISVSSSYLDIDEVSPPPKKSVPGNSPSTAADRNNPAQTYIIPEPKQMNKNIPAYSVSQVRLEEKLLPAINSTPYVYNEAVIVPLFYVSYKFFPEISLEVCQMALRQIIGVNLYVSNRYITETLGKVCRLPQTQDKIVLVKWTDLQTNFNQLSVIMNEISRRLVAGDSSEVMKHIQSLQVLTKTPQLQNCSR